MSIKGNSSKSIRKKVLSSDRNPVVGVKSIKFYHQATVGQTIIDINNLVTPSGFINPSPAELSTIMLKTFQSNFSIYNGTGNHLLENLGYDLVTETTIKLKVPALASEVFKGYLSNNVVNGTVIADVRTPGSTGTLLAGQFSFNLGEVIQIKELNNSFPILVYRSIGGVPTVMSRNTLNGTIGGDYQMIDRGDGFCQVITFNTAGGVGGEAIMWSSRGAVAERVDISTIQHVDKLNGIVDTMRSDLLKATGNNILDPTRYDNGVPTNSDLRSFGDKVLTNENQLSTLEPRVATLETHYDINELLSVLLDKQHSVGEVKTAFVSEAVFQSQNSTKWVLCDGRNVAGSAYQTLTGNANIPDARGTALRGKDNGRGLNPDGNFTLGAYQGDNFQSHSHGFNYRANSSAIDGWSLPRFPPANGAWQRTRASQAVGFLPVGHGNNPVTYSGGNETRMKNITVNFFIKIN